MGKREEIEDMYRQLQWLAAEEGEVPTPYCGNLTDEEGSVSEDVLGDFFLLLTEMYPCGTSMPEWVLMYVQLYSWQYQAQYEGVQTYYENMYGSDLEDGIAKLSDSLHRHGFREMAKWYDYGIFDYKLYANAFMPEEQGARTVEIEKWINAHGDELWRIYQELLMGNKEELFREAVRREECETAKQGGESSQKAAGDVPGTGQEATETRQEQEKTGQEAAETRQEQAKNGEKPVRKRKFNWYIDSSQLNDEVIAQLAEAKEVKTIHVREHLPRETGKLLEQKVYSVRDDIQLRIFSYGAEEVFDLLQIEEIHHVQNLNIGPVKDVEHAEVLSRFTYLKFLWLNLEKRQDYGFVNDLPKGLTKLFIGIGEDVEEYTFGDPKPNEMEWLLRFSDLQFCYMGNYKKDLELLTRVDSVREMRLYEMPCPSMKVLNQLKIGKLVVHRKQAEGLEMLGEAFSLREIELVDIEDLRSLDFMANLPNLEKIVLRRLPELTSLPQFPQGHGILEIEAYDCGKLSDLSAVKGMPHLRKLRLYSVGISEEAAKDVVSGRTVGFQYYD